jgi:hypothetical protein
VGDTKRREGFTQEHAESGGRTRTDAGTSRHRPARRLTREGCASLFSRNLTHGFVGLAIRACTPPAPASFSADAGSDGHRSSGLGGDRRCLVCRPTDHLYGVDTANVF